MPKIRLSNIISNVPLQRKLEILADLHDKFNQYSIHELCDALDVARGTFYYFLLKFLRFSF